MAAILLSAGLFVFFFMLPDYLFCLGFIWLLPLIRADKTSKFRFYDGFVWGLVFFPAHLAWLAYIIMKHGHGVCRIMIFIFTISYFSLLSGLWLELKYQLMKITNNKLYYCVWIVSSMLFLWFVCYGSLFFLGRFEGYVFCNPLISFMGMHGFKSIVFCCGQLPCWLMLLSVNCMFAACLDVKRYSFLIVLCLIILLFSFKKSESELLDFEFAEFGYIAPKWNETKGSASKKFYATSHAIDCEILRQKKNLLLMPESSFNFNLKDWETDLQAWTSLLDESGQIVIGSHQKIGDVTYNCAYCISDGKIVQSYNKQHLVPFTERVPLCFGSLPLFHGLFITQDLSFSYPDLQNNDLFSIQNSMMQVFICSELYFEQKEVKGLPILFLTNDDWLGLGYAQRFAYNYAKLFSMRHHVPIVYVATHHCDILR